MRNRRLASLGIRPRAIRLSLDVLEDRITPSTFLVTNALDPRGTLVRGSLRWGVAQANLPRNQGSTVAITPAMQNSITLRAGEISIRSSLTIENESGHPSTIQQRSPNSRVFQIVNNPRTTAATISGLGATSTLTLTGGHVRNGNGGAETFGIAVTGQSQVAHNTLTNDEDALVTSGLISVGLDPVIQRAFVSGGRGDAVLKAALQLFVNACAGRASMIEQADNAFPEGTDEVGGGISSVLSGPIEVSTGSDVSDNGFASTKKGEAAIGVGAGIFANLGPITIVGSTISGNIATSDGGGIWNGSSLSISNSLVTQNQAVGHGGGIFNQGTFTSSNTSVVNNTPDNIYSIA